VVVVVVVVAASPTPRMGTGLNFFALGLGRGSCLARSFSTALRTFSGLRESFFKMGNPKSVTCVSKGRVERQCASGAAWSQAPGWFDRTRSLFSNSLQRKW
jgi:hypothetical protein